MFSLYLQYDNTRCINTVSSLSLPELKGQLSKRVKKVMYSSSRAFVSHRVANTL